ncbi:hypothetical protein D9611_006076 [Ephemerocybe angulata]|uniref:Fungal-type protein kinase domain-containing protein n=1 Tax=Ephemerocybe angulata TaxID=980116 RepID=A0A8H5CFT7_9AGAR|nr:hypothetical protein D9611_006076 [Tulosesus angulatus]
MISRLSTNLLAATSLYDYGSNAWTDIPCDAQGDEDLHGPFMKVINGVLEGLGNSKGTRDVVDSRAMIFRHRDDSAQVSSPHIAVRATGPSFELPKGQYSEHASVGFSNVASVFNVKREATITEDDVDHLAVYTRQIFFCQKNRLFSRSLLLSESRVRLLHCDRSGAYKTTAIDIHEDPCTFVRLVLGLSSPRETVLGLDTNIQWTVKHGRRVAGTIATLNASGRRIKYKLDPDSFCFAAQTVRGRGTVCWNAENKDGKRILIKDAWRTDPQVPEYAFLERAKGLEGVVQLLAHEGSVARTSAFRPDCFDFNSDDFYNRTMSRVTMVRCGASLSQFTSQFQAIAALRDAIQGHLNLLKAGVLHRDVSMDNILFGDDEATVGNRGVVIDLDMAIMVKGPSADVITELPAGTQLYQSISVLDYKGELVPVPHDYLDDLESFFYILCHLLYGYEGFDRPAPAAFTGMKVLALWENMPAEAATNMKLRYIELEGPNINKPPLFWSTACIKLCDSLRRYLLPLIDGKIKLRVTRDDVERGARAKELHKDLEEHYSDIIALFDVALEELPKPGGEDPRVLPIRAPVTPSSSEASYESTESSGSTRYSGSSNSASSSAKRSSDDLEDAESSPPKRQRSV